MSRFLFFILIVASLGSFTVLREAEEVTGVARNGLQKFLAMIPSGHEADYGFSRGEHLQSCTVGVPFRMVGLSAEFYNSTYVPGRSYVVDGKQWRVPVILGGQYKTLLTVAGKSGDFNVIDLGGAGLATDLQRAGKLVGAADNYFILRIHPLACDFLAAGNTQLLDDAAIVPLTSAIMAMPELQTKQTYTLAELLPVIRKTLDQQSKN